MPTTLYDPCQANLHVGQVLTPFQPSGSSCVQLVAESFMEDLPRDSYISVDHVSILFCLLVGPLHVCGAHLWYFPSLMQRMRASLVTVPTGQTQLHTVLVLGSAPDGPLPTCFRFSPIIVVILRGWSSRLPCDVSSIVSSLGSVSLFLHC